MDSFKYYLVIARNIRAENFNHSCWCYTEYNTMRPHENTLLYHCKIGPSKKIEGCKDFANSFDLNSEYIDNGNEFDVTNIMEFLRGDKTFDEV